MEDNKRTILAIALCVVVLLGWSFLSREMGWAPEPVVAEQQATQTPSPSAAPAPAVSDPLVFAPVFTPSEGRDVKVETPLFSAVFYSGGGVLRSFSLKKYAENLEEDSPLVNMISPSAASTAPLGLVVNGQPSWSTGRWSYDGGDVTVEAGKTATLTFTGEVDGVRIQRVFTIEADNYFISEVTSMRPVGAEPRTVRLGLTVGATPLTEGSSYDPTRICWSDNGSYSQDADADDLTSEGKIVSGTIGWAGVTSNYFMSMIVPADTKNQTMKARIENSVWRVGLEQPAITVTPAADTAVKTGWWFGPKDRTLLERVPNDLDSAVNYGFFSIIARPLLVILNFFESYVHNWGIAILLLTLCIRVVFWPLSQKSYKSMEQMKRLQPMMQKLREKYKDDKETLNREVMQLYRTYGVNPASGCLPILVQIPVFIGLYQALLNAIQLRHASFITYLPFTDIPWLADLSAKDPYYITPILMGATMFLQQRLSPPAGDPTQQKIMMFLPLIFTVMFLNFPAGLVVYWLLNNILSIGQQWWMLRKVKVAAPAGK